MTAPVIQYGNIRPPIVPAGELVPARDDNNMPILYSPVTEKSLKAGTGQKALDLAYAMISNWTRITESEKVVTALWIAHTWFTDGGEKPRLVFRATPRWLAIAPPSHGKTRVMEVMQSLVRDGSSGILNAPLTAPGVRNLLTLGESVFIDEVHRQFNTGKGHLDLQSILTGGYTNRGGAVNAYGGKNAQSIFGPVALGARPALETATGEELDDIFQRSFIIRPEKSFDDIPELDADFEEIVPIALKWFSDWAGMERPQPTRDDPKPLLWPIYQVNPKLKGRPKQIASTLLAVADRADQDDQGRTDLRWPLRARKAVDQMLLGGDSDREALEQRTEDVLGKLGLALG